MFFSLIRPLADYFNWDYGKVYFMLLYGYSEFISM